MFKLLSTISLLENEEMTRLCRQALYEMIWKEPNSKVAPRFNIFNVALAKICLKHGIPRPPRGYWAKLTAGKPVTRIDLPRRGLGMSQHIELDNKNRWHYSRPTNPDQVEIVLCQNLI